MNEHIVDIEPKSSKVIFGKTERFWSRTANEPLKFKWNIFMATVAAVLAIIFLNFGDFLSAKIFNLVMNTVLVYSGIHFQRVRSKLGTEGFRIYNILYITLLALVIFAFFAIVLISILIFLMGFFCSGQNAQEFNGLPLIFKIATILGIVFGFVMAFRIWLPIFADIYESVKEGLESFFSSQPEYTIKHLVLFYEFSIIFIGFLLSMAIADFIHQLDLINIKTCF